MLSAPPARTSSEAPVCTCMHAYSTACSPEPQRRAGSRAQGYGCGPMRRLLLLVSVLVFADTMLYAALTPLLPHFAHALHLAKSQAGALVAAYAIGALIGAVPGGLAAVCMAP